MNRLTFKNNDLYGSIVNEHIIVNKLGKIEDTEEKLGIDTNIVFEAIEKGIDILDNGGNYILHPVLRIVNREYCFTRPAEDMPKIMNYRVKDFNKTWKIRK